MNKLNLAKWLLTVPAVTTWTELLTNSPVWSIIDNVAWATSHVLEAWNSLLNPLFSSVTWWASAWLLTHNILKEFDWMNEHQKTKWLLSLAAWWAWFLWGSALAPYLLTWWVAYMAWKHWWKYSKEALKRVGWAAWWLTWWAVKWVVVWAWKSVMAWIKWQQKLNPVI
jgi:hypothetical protein